MLDVDKCCMTRYPAAVLAGDAEPIGESERLTPHDPATPSSSDPEGSLGE